MNLFYNRDEYKDSLSSNLNVTWEIVQENPDCNWNYDFMGTNSSITWDIVQANPDKPWNYKYLSTNPNITCNIVESNPDKQWKYEYLSYNPSITWDTVKSNPDKPWDYEFMSTNSSITWDIVQSNPDKPWNYNILSYNPNITWDIVQSNPDKQWNYNTLSANPNITCDIVELILINNGTVNVLMDPQRALRGGAFEDPSSGCVVRRGFHQHAPAATHAASGAVRGCVLERIAACRARPPRATVDLPVRRRLGPVPRMVIRRRRDGGSDLEPRGGRGGLPQLGAARCEAYPAEMAKRHLAGRPQDRRNPGGAAHGGRGSGSCRDRRRAQCVAVGRRAARHRVHGRACRRDLGCVPGAGVPECPGGGSFGATFGYAG